MTTAEITYGTPSEVADFLSQCPSDQISKEDLTSALINALNRIAELEKKP